MRIQRISQHVYLLDPEPLGYDNQIALYLIVGEKTLIVDSGPRLVVDSVIELISNVLSNEMNKLSYIALTHIHIDHGGGVSTLVKKLKTKHGVDVRVLVHPRGVKHLVDPSKLWRASVEVLGEAAIIQGEPEPLPIEYIRAVNDHEEVDLGEVVVKVLHTPGHAPHHVVYMVYPDNIVISGDAVAIHYDGRIHPVSPPPFRIDLAINSIDKIIALNPKTVAVSHYGIVHGNGVDFLKRSKNKIIEWYEIIKRFVHVGKINPEEILKEILYIDEETRYIVSVRENNPVFKGSALQSVRGILGYIITNQTLLDSVPRE